MAQLYRKSSIEKLSNPEQLDRTIKISSSMSWLALIGVFFIIVATIVWSVVGTLPTTELVNGIIVSPENVGAVYSNDVGNIKKILKKSGDKIVVGDDIAIIKKTDGKEVIVESDFNGVLTDILTEEGSKVYPGFEIARYTPNISDKQVIVCYVPISSAKQLEKNMKVLVYPASIDSQKYGHMEAVIDSIGTYAVNTNNMWYILGSDNLVAEQFITNGPVVSVICKIKKDSATKSGFYWSSDNGKNITLTNSTYISANIVIDESAPITKFINNLKDKLEG